jgi:hypothetical protein
MKEFTQGVTIDRLAIGIVLFKKRRTRSAGVSRDHPFACPASGDGVHARCIPCHGSENMGISLNLLFLKLNGELYTLNK